MTDGVFVFTADKKLVAMQSAEFPKEDDFQGLLVDFPSLLSGEQIDPISPRRWLLVCREKSVPIESGGSGWFSVDHLFLDQDGIPTFVEVKRQSDTRPRREVVAQMLDYAANAIAYWPVDELRTTFAAKHTDPEQELSDFLGEGIEVEAFWQGVKTNLLAGRVRLLFVADKISPELRRIVEFLNQQMDPAEVLALELRQYQGEGLRTLVPVLYGQTQAAQQKKSTGESGRQWTEEEVYDALQSDFGTVVEGIARQITTRMKNSGAEISVGKGGTASIRYGLSCDGHKFNPIKVWTTGTVEIGFGTMLNSSFKDEHKRRDLLLRINQIDDVKLPEGAINKYPTIRLDVFKAATSLEKLFDALDWFVEELRAAG